MLREPQDGEGGTKSIIETLFVLLVWIIGLVSAIYLACYSLYLLFLAVIFGFNAPPTPVLRYLLFVGTNAIPAICFIVLGICGLVFWPSKRFWVFGLVAIMIETAVAIYDVANPESMLILNLVPN